MQGGLAFSQCIAAVGDALGLQEPRIRRILDRLEAATKPEDMNLPGYKFHGLKGDRKNTYAVSVSGNRRITFAFDGGDAVDVNLEDYH